MTNLPKGIHLTVPMFSAYEAEKGGYLVRDPACHACFYYAMIATNAYKQVMEDHVLDDAADPHANFREVFKNVASMYGVEPETMARFWVNVRMQFQLLQLEDIPQVVQDAQESHFIRETNDVKLLNEGMDPGLDFEAMIRSWKKD